MRIGNCSIVGNPLTGKVEMRPSFALRDPNSGLALGGSWALRPASEAVSRVMADIAARIERQP